MFYTYILKSKKSGKFYIGYTSNINQRLKYHNSKKVTSTKNFIPWEIFHVEEFINEKDAIHREKQLKSWKSRKAIEKLKF